MVLEPSEDRHDIICKFYQTLESLDYLTDDTKAGNELYWDVPRVECIRLKGPWVCLSVCCLILASELNYALHLGELPVRLGHGDIIPCITHEVSWPWNGILSSVILVELMLRSPSSHTQWISICMPCIARMFVVFIFGILIASVLRKFIVCFNNATRMFFSYERFSSVSYYMYVNGRIDNF